MVDDTVCTRLMHGGDNHPNKCLLSWYYSRQQVRHLFTLDWLSMEWNSIKKRKRLIHVNIATTRPIRCAATSGLAYRHVAYLVAASWVSSGANPGDGPRPWPLVHVRRYSQPFSRTAYITNARLATVQPSLGAWIIGPAVLPEAQCRPGPFNGTARTKNSPTRWIQKRIRAHPAVHVNGLMLTGPARAENRWHASG